MIDSSLPAAAGPIEGALVPDDLEGLVRSSVPAEDVETVLTLLRMDQAGQKRYWSEQRKAAIES